MRLIDADELKKELAKNITIWTFNVSYDGILAEVIDNAPTVETDIEVATKDAYEQGYTDGWKERFGEPNERPQGDLISRSELKAFIKKYYKQTSQIKSLLSFIDTQKGGAE